MPQDRIAADPAQLFEIATQVRLLSDDLSQAEAHFDDEWYESHDIESALHDFVRAWSDRRAELIDLLVGSHNVLIAAAEGFLEVDSTMAAALSGDSSAEAS